MISMQYGNISEYPISNIVAYLRRSRQDVDREKRTGEDTLNEQDVLMNKVLKEFEIPYEVFKEIGSGDKIETRPVFQSVLKDLKDKIFDAVAVKEISRLGRGSYTDMGQIFDLIVDKRIYIITPYKIYDPQNPSDKRQIRFEIFLSREEFEMTRERLVGARYNYAMQGKWMAGSGIPYGYILNSETGKLQPDEETAKNIKLIFDLYVNGINGKEVAFRSIATYLGRLGIKTAKGLKTWNPQTISRMVQNSVYVGQVRYRISQVVDGKRETRPEKDWIIASDSHESLVGDLLWYDAQKKFASKERLPKVKMDFSPCELAGIIICADCGHKMVRQYSVQNYKKKDNSVVQYHKEFLWCPSDDCGSVKYRNVENLIIEFLERLNHLDSDKLLLLLKEYTNTQTDDINQKEQLKQIIIDKEKELKNRLTFIKDKYESGVYSDEEFIERRAKINKELEDLEKVNIPEEKENTFEKINVNTTRSKISSIVKVYKTIKNKTDKNQILRKIFNSIDVIIIEKGAGRTPAKIRIRPDIKLSFLVLS
jgi:DNA invertase Pin-like site-specific DNA recombinase